MTKITTPNDPAHHIAVFQETTIRRVWHNEEWWFAIVDVVGVLTDSADPEAVRVMRGAPATSFTKPLASALGLPHLALAQTPCHG